MLPQYKPVPMLPYANTTPLLAATGALPQDTFSPRPSIQPKSLIPPQPYNRSSGKSEKNPLLIAGGVTAAAALGIAGYLLLRKKPTISELKMPVAKASAQAALIEQAFPIPAGLETPQRRRQLATKIVDDCYDKLFNAYKNKKDDVSWAEESNRIFNQSIQKYLHPQFRGDLRIAPPRKPGEDSPRGLFYGTFKKENELFQLGDIFIRDTELDNLKNKGFKLILQHELTHLLFGLAHQGEKRPSQYPPTAWDLMPLILGRPTMQVSPKIVELQTLESLIKYLKGVIQSPDINVAQLNNSLVSDIISNIKAENLEQAIDCLKHTVINEYEARISELLGSSLQKVTLDNSMKAQTVLEARLLQEWAEIMAQEIKKYRQDFTMPEMEKLSDVINLNQKKIRANTVTLG